jgi:Uri superfamily endonuclease
MQPAASLSGKGSYILWFKNKKEIAFTAGKLGTYTLQPGIYAYCGSALGSGGLKARIGRHLRKDKKIHWHIDYLTAVLPVAAVWYVQSEKRYEHLLTALLLQRKGSGVPISHFGNSDCTECESHLVYLPAMPRISTINNALKEKGFEPLAAL